MGKRIFSAVVVFISGVVIGAAISAHSQTFVIATDTAGHVLSTTQPKAVVLSGDDLQLRVVGHRSGRVVGKLMAKVDGKWVEVQFAAQDSFVRQ